MRHASTLRWPARAAAAYALALLGWQALRFTPVADRWPFALVDIFGWALFAPLSLLVPLAALLRQTRALLWLAAPLLLFAWDYGPAFLPRAAPASAEGVPLRVVTANLVWVNAEADSLQAAIEREQPDVIALQELGSAMADGLTSRLRDRYPYRALHPRIDTKGMGVLSRYPIRSASAPEMGVGQCSCQEVSIEIDGRVSSFLNVHPESPAVDLRFVRGVPLPLGYDDRERSLMMPVLLGRIEAASTPLVVLGDFNTGDREPPYRALHSRLRDSYREAGWGFGFTFPHGAPDGWAVPPLVRIDYVLHNNAWEARRAWTGQLPESNHRYVVADLLLRPA